MNRLSAFRHWVSSVSVNGMSPCQFLCQLERYFVSFKLGLCSMFMYSLFRYRILQGLLSIKSEIREILDGELRGNFSRRIVRCEPNYLCFASHMTVACVSFVSSPFRRTPNTYAFTVTLPIHIGSLVSSDHSPFLHLWVRLS